MEENYKIVPITVRGVSFKMRVPKKIDVAQLDCEEEDKLRFWIDGKNVSIQLPLVIRATRSNLREFHPSDEQCYFTLEIDAFRLDFRAPPPPCVGA